MGTSRRVRISLKTALAAMTFVALACALVTQQLRLATAKASLSRYESTVIPTSLEEDQFRVIPRIILDTSHCKVVTYRIETRTRHSAVVKCDGDSNSAGANQDAENELYFSEVTILIDHVKATNSLKLLPKVGGAQGYAIMDVPKDFSLEKSAKLHREQGVFQRDAKIELFRLDGRIYTLSLGP